MREQLHRRGPKRRKPIKSDVMVNVTIRLSADLLGRVDVEAARLARETGVLTLNRSDLVRALLERSLEGRS